MSTWRIDPDSERWIELGRRFAQLRTSGVVASRTAGWRSARFLSRIALFVIAIVIAVASFGIFNALHIPMWAGGLVVLLAAEFLIVQRRFAFCGLEEGLHLAALLMIAFGTLEALNISSREEVVVPMSAALVFALSGLRLLNPLFTAGAVVALSFAIESSLDHHDGSSSLRALLIAGVACYAAGLLALGAGGWRFRRPSHDRMLDCLVIVMPVASYLYLAARHDFAPLDYLASLVDTTLLTVLLPGLFAALALMSALRRRTHAPLIACMACTGCTAYELRHLTGLAMELRLIAWGAGLLVFALLLEFWLRIPRRGIVSRQLSAAQDAVELLELAGTATLMPPRSAPDESYPAADGRFGGGGASGSF